MAAADPIELITRIRYMMEYMTLCANPTLFDSEFSAQPWPVPSGIPISIVTLPDFVVDVAVDEIRKATATRRGQIEPLDVGGRAGRLARVLQDFGGQQNAWYSVKYLAKAGEVGRVVLDRRFVKSRTGPDFESVSLRYIIESAADHDWLHVYGEATKPVESSSEGLEITISDIDESRFSVTDLFVDARYIVIASKHGDPAISAVSLVAEGLHRLSGMIHDRPSSTPSDPIPIGILVDLSALENSTDVPRVVESFAKLKQRASAFAVDSTALCKRPLEFGAKHFEHVLVRETGVISSGNYRELLPEPRIHQVSREALTAGYALASACNLGWKLLRQWYRYCSKMRPIDGRAHKSWPRAEDSQSDPLQVQTDWLPSLAIEAADAISPEEKIQFAALLARFTNSTPISYGELVKQVARSNTRTLNKVEKQEVEFATTPEDGFHQRAAELEYSAALDAHLVPRFDDPDANGTLSLYLPTSELQALASSCLLRDARRRVACPKKEIDKSSHVRPRRDAHRFGRDAASVLVQRPAHFLQRGRLPVTRPGHSDHHRRLRNFCL